MSRSPNAKLCPACGRAVKLDKTSCHWNCGHVFSGDEVGAHQEHSRLKTEPQVLSEDQIDIHLAALSGERQPDPSAQAKDVDYFRENASGCALGAGIVVLIAAIAYILARLGVLKGSGWTSGDWATASIVTALLVIGLAAWYILKSLYWLRRVHARQPLSNS